MKRKATAVWQGTGKDGKGQLSTQSGVLEQTQYSYKSRFEEGKGTNPEELIAAAHSGCFTMKLSFNLTEAGFTPDKLETNCTITLDNGSITKSELEVKAQVPGIDEAKFKELLQDAEKNCPVSKLLNTDISSSYTLNQ
ncbi:OsmC family protein [Pontibacter oryzae]|uniref:OsmC family peroxiredoxin n=1 Tax=Pontibacter oryzae TaxID=2304593 RepID=A0A399SJF3_9BACT|nr:OsmC family protein [Pontibacter oryzae]RIJ42027.1 OsmC family peroxiredoxin [Pontibacter oryzae]